MRANRRRLWVASVAGVLLGGLIVLSVISAMAAQDQDQAAATLGTAATTVPGAAEGEVEVTDTTVAGRWEEGTWVEGSAQSEGLEATDITQPPPPEPEESAAAQQTEQTRPTPTVTTVPAETTRPYYLTRSYHLRRIHHPTWDDRLPSTWEGFPATECAATLGLLGIYFKENPSWDWYYHTEGSARDIEAMLINLALGDPSFEFEPGREGYEKWLDADVLYGPTFRTRHEWSLGLTYEKYTEDYEPWYYGAMASLGVSSLQDIRDMGEGAVNVRWYASRVKGWIELFDGDPSACASILAGAEAVLTPYTSGATSTTVAS